jgi:hypothetical protein
LNAALAHFENDLPGEFAMFSPGGRPDIAHLQAQSAAAAIFDHP